MLESLISGFGAGEVILGVSTAAAAYAKFRATDIVKEVRDVMREMDDIQASFADARQAFEAAKADGVLEPEEIEVVAEKFMVLATDLAEFTHELADLLDKGTALIPGKVGKEVQALRARIPIVKSKAA